MQHLSRSSQRRRVPDTRTSSLCQTASNMRLTEHNYIARQRKRPIEEPSLGGSGMSERDLKKLTRVCVELGVPIPENWRKRGYRYLDAVREVDDLMRERQ